MNNLTYLGFALWTRKAVTGFVYFKIGLATIEANYFPIILTNYKLK